MKIILIHGDYDTEIEKAVIDYIAKAKNKDYLINDLRQEKNVENLANCLKSGDLFSSKKLVLCDYSLYLSLKLKYKHISLDDDNLFLLIVAKKILLKGDIHKLGDLYKESLLTVPKLIWSFLESMYPNNRKNIINLYSKVSKVDAKELVYYLIYKQFLQIYQIKSKTEFASLGWKVTKLKNQASKYKKIEIVNIIKYLSEGDALIKSGNKTTEEVLEYLFTILI